MLTEKGYNAVIENLRDKVGDLVSENNTLRAELHKAKQEAARFEDAYIRLYKQKVKEER